MAVRCSCRGLIWAGETCGERWHWEGGSAVLMILGELDILSCTTGVKA